MTKRAPSEAVALDKDAQNQGSQTSSSGNKALHRFAKSAKNPFKIRKVPLDTITTRFFMVFIFLLAVPLVSVILFTLSMLQNEAKESALRQIKLMQDSFLARLEFREQFVQALAQEAKQEPQVCSKPIASFTLRCVAVLNKPVSSGYRWMGGALWYFTPLSIDIPSKTNDGSKAKNYNVIGFALDNAYINHFYRQIPSASGHLALVPYRESISNHGQVVVHNAVFSQGMDRLQPSRWLNTALLDQWMEDTAVQLPLDKYGDYWIMEHQLYGAEGHKMASVVFLVPSVLHFKFQNYYVGIYVLSVSGVILAAILAMVAGRPITQPLLRMIEQMQEIRHSNVRAGLQVVDVHGVYEINQLAQAFNSLLLRLKQEHLMQDEFVATLTHDLKVPMLAEKQTLNYLLNNTYGELNETQKEILHVIETTNGESLTLVNGLLEVYRYESGIAKLNMDTLDIRTLLRQTITALKPLANEKHITLELASKIPEDALTLAYGDSIELRRVLHNLISNAITNTPHYGNILCRLENEESLGKENIGKISNFIRTTLESPILLSRRILVSIQDSGIGFDTEDLPKLFQQFSANRGRNPMSMGLGLFNCHQVIEAHNGVIWVESTEGEGAAVSFVVPQSLESFKERRRKDRRKII